MVGSPGLIWHLGGICGGLRTDSGAEEEQRLADLVGEGVEQRRFELVEGDERAWERSAGRFLWRGRRRRQSGPGIRRYGERLVSD